MYVCVTTTVRGGLVLGENENLVALNHDDDDELSLVVEGEDREGVVWMGGR
jgi:hypothetical protein